MKTHYKQFATLARDKLRDLINATNEVQSTHKELIADVRALQKDTPGVISLPSDAQVEENVYRIIQISDMRRS